MEGGGQYRIEAIQHCNIVHLSCFISLFLPPFLSTQSGGESPVHIAAKWGTDSALELIWEWCDVFGTEGENGGKFEPFKEPDEVSFMKCFMEKETSLVEYSLLLFLSAERLDSASPRSGYQPKHRCRVAVGERTPDKAECGCTFRGWCAHMVVCSVHDNSVWLLVFNCVYMSQH